jgi:hypothetical protein
MLWRGSATIVAVETQQCIVCVAELHVTVSCVKILNGCTALLKWQIYVAGNNETRSRTPLIRVNWDGEPSGYAESPDNWIFI